MVSTFFLGACSCKGFVSHYDSLFRDVKELTIIKGGSGCGKSTFMKAIGKAATERGFDVSYILCASDPDSVDGVLIPALDLGYVDGTDPHVLEPVLCGGSETYLSFSDFYHREGMKGNEEEIRSVQQKNKAQYQRIHSCLRAVEGLLDCIRCETDTPVYSEEMEAIGECLCLSALKPKFGTGTQSRRFLSALTPRGIWLCRETPAALCPKVYVLKDDYLLAPQVLSMVEEKALSYGYDCISCYTPLLPCRVPSHLLIPELGVAFVSDCKLFPYTGESFCSIDLNSSLPPRIRKELSFVGQTAEELLKVTVEYLKTAKVLHDRIENLCKPFVDFTAVTELTQQTVSHVFSL
ncbi:MAG: hypothetical protein IKM59_00740 [Oscillospiraceae bacterium]|nr:hypothetical protein [Oscillospiraceae bacterium]